MKYIDIYMKVNKKQEHWNLVTSGPQKRDKKNWQTMKYGKCCDKFSWKTFIPQTGKSKEAEESLTLKWLAMCIMLDYTNATVRFLWAFTYYLEYFNNAIKQVWPIMIWLFIHNHFIMLFPQVSLYLNGDKAKIKNAKTIGRMKEDYRKSQGWAL